MAISILEAGMVLVPMILSLTVHEYAHALASRSLGDTTAQQQGRLTLNPIAHIDMMGTLVLPIILLLSGTGFFFGWAKPVPIDPTRFRRDVPKRIGMMITAAAGPLSNVLLAAVAQGILAWGYHGTGLHQGPVTHLVMRMLMINVALAVFNMIPIYPLDGQKVLLGLLPTDLALGFERVSLRYGSIVLILLVLFGGSVIGVPFSWFMKGLAAIFGMPPLA